MTKKQKLLDKETEQETIKKDDCLAWKNKDGSQRYYETKREAIKVARKMEGYKIVCQSCSGYYFIY